MEKNCYKSYRSAKKALFSKKCRQNWVFTNRTENRCRRAGRAYFRTNGYPKSY